MPKKSSMAAMREWLRQADEGKPVAAIAKEARRDVRTINTGIETVRKEIEAMAARVEILRDALIKHQRDLGGELELLRSAVTVLGPGRLSLPVGEITSQEIALSQAKLINDGKGGRTVKLDIESTVQWTLLQQHLARDPVWKALVQWKMDLAEHVANRLELNGRVLKVLHEKTGLDLLQGTPRAGASFLYPTAVYAVSSHLLERAMTVGDDLDPENRLKVRESGVEFGDERIPILTIPEKAAEYKKKLILAFQTLQRPGVTNRPAVSYRATEDSAKKLDRSIEELLLMRLVPGRCSVCKRLGV